MPETGNRDGIHQSVFAEFRVVVVRTVVLTTTARLCGPVERLVIAPLATEHEAPVGSPVQLIETDPGNPVPVGLT